MGSDWDYGDEHGPSKWAELGYEPCAGESQSPVDLSNAVEDGTGCALDFQGYKVPVKGTWQNNGHSLQFTLDKDSLDLPSVTTCDDVFELLQVRQPVELLKLPWALKSTLLGT